MVDEGDKVMGTGWQSQEEVPGPLCVVTLGCCTKLEHISAGEWGGPRSQLISEQWRCCDKEDSSVVNRVITIIPA